jgi:hypothetical protein
VLVNRLYDVAQLLVSSWVLAEGGTKLPTTQGLLDRALKTALDRGSLPQWAARELHFADSRTGLRCIELPAILEWAQSGELTGAPNPSYRSVDLKVGARVAGVMLRRLSIPEGDAAKLGRDLKEALEAQDFREGAA